MDERLIKFVVLVDVGSFTKAASKLHISQPALTVTIKNLERELGHQLLLREGKKVTTTAAGRLVYKSAKNIEDQAYNLTHKLSELNNIEKPVSIGMIDSIAEASIVDQKSLTLFRTQSNTSLTVDNSAQLISEVNQGSLDFAFVTAPNIALPNSIDMRAVGTEPLIIVTHNSRKAVLAKDIKLGIITGFVSYNQTSNTDLLLKNYFVSKGLGVDTIFHSTSPRVILQIILSKNGVAALPYNMVERPLKQGLLIPVFIQQSCIIDRDICYIQRKNRDEARFASSLRVHITQILYTLHDNSNSIRPYK